MEESGESKLQRIFVGNLPNNIKLAHLFSVLPTGYDKSQVEIKHNYDIDKNITSSFAFVNLEGTSSQIKEWCDIAAKKSIGGNVIVVQFAKLSFLERLKLEVNNEKAKKKSFNNTLPNSPKEQIVASNSTLVNAKTQFSSSESDSDDYEVQGKTNDKQLGNIVPTKIKSNDAEVRRLESLKEKSNTQMNQKKLIRLALSKKSEDSSNKTIFQDSDEDSIQDVEACEEGSKKRKLFDESDSEGEEVDFSASKPKIKQIKTQISSIDDRFRMDSKFFDEDDKVVTGTDDQLKDSEQDKLLQIADSIIEKDPNVRRKIKNKKEIATIPTRYDPLQKAHSSLIVKRDEDVEEEIVKPIKVKPFKVAKNRFYDVSDNLTKQFKNTGNSEFSLLTLFGGENAVANESDISEVRETNMQEDPHFKTKNVKNLLTMGIEHFFNVNDDSESEDENHPKKKSKATSKCSWREPLFLTVKDPRVEEALEFFNSPPEDTVPHCILRTHLKKIIKKKHRNNTAKVKAFKTKLGNRRKFRDKDNKKTSTKSTLK